MKVMFLFVYLFLQHFYNLLRTIFICNMFTTKLCYNKIKYKIVAFLLLLLDGAQNYIRNGL